MYQRFLKVKGNAYQRGVETGKKLKEQIVTNYQNQTQFYQQTEGYDYEQWRESSKNYLPFIEEHAPEVLEEMKGMAEGAELEFDQVLALTTAYEKSFLADRIIDKCTIFLTGGEATTDGGIICGQTNDEGLDEWLHELDVVINHEDEDGFEVMTYTHPGIPAYMGINNQGLTVLWSYIDNGQLQLGVPTTVIIRELLNFTTVEAAVEYLKTIPHGVPNHFAIAQKNGEMVCVECYPNAVYTKYDKNWMTHTNHNIFSGEEEYSVSATTKERLKNITDQVLECYGKIDANLGKEFLRSHRDFPRSICVHPNARRARGKTLAAMVFDLDKGDMHIAYGNPCELPYKTYQFASYVD